MLCDDLLILICGSLICLCFFFFNDTATTEIYPLSLHDALPIWGLGARCVRCRPTDGASLSRDARRLARPGRSEEHTSELQSPCNLVCRLLLEKKKTVTSVKCPFLISEYDNKVVYKEN